MKRIKFLLIPAVCAALAFSSCKVCKQCHEYTGEDGNGDPTYSATSAEKCGNELKDAEDEMTTPLVGTPHHKYDCRVVN